MKTLYRYIISSFIKPFFYSILIFSMFMLFGSAFEKLKFFTGAEKSFLLLVKYLFFQLPFLISMIIPLSYLLATIFLINSFMNSGQWKAFISGGYKPFDLIKPMLFFAIFVGVFHFLFNEFIMNPFYFKSKVVYNEEFKKNYNWNQQLISKSFKIKDKFIQYGYYIPSEKLFKDVIIEEIDKKNFPVRKIKANSMKWENGSWVLNEVLLVEYINSNSEEVKTKQYYRFYIDLIPPQDIVLNKLVDNGINFFDLRQRIKKLKNSGIKTDMEYIVLNSKISQPFSNFTMCFLASAIVLGGFIQGRYLNIGLAIFVGFIYWSLSVFFQRMAEIKLISPFLSAFLPHFIFIGFSLIVFKVKKIF